MASVLRRLVDKDLLHPPPWLMDNLMFEGVVGSTAYGCNKGGDTDEDLVGMAIPPKGMVFPHLEGYIPGFGAKPPTFNSFQQHHIFFSETKTQYDVCIYGIVKLFQLCRDNNPNMLELLYLPRRCIKHSSQVYEHIRSNRSLFLHRGCYQKFRGYAYSQIEKMDKPGEHRSKKRRATVEAHGFDTKFAYHLVRLMLECEQIFLTQSLQLDRDRNLFKSIRRGEWSKEKIREWFDEKEKGLERLYKADFSEVPLPHSPDEEAIKQVLIECLEMHYGSLSKAVVRPDAAGLILNELRDIVHRYDK